MAICRQCDSEFELLDLSKFTQNFNGKDFKIPNPTLCPVCRAQRRYIWRAELHLFKQKCYLSNQDILTFYPPGSKCKIVRKDMFWGDSWDPLAYGRYFDFSRPFFEQFKELISEVPLLCLAGKNNEINSEYVNNASWNKNCYLIAGANYNEDCYYGNYVNSCVSCIDNNFISECELCYNCIDCKNCFNLQYSQNCINCHDSYFLRNCQSCNYCFGSVNLVGKQYYFFNEELSKEKYKEKIKELELDKYSSIQKLKSLFEKHKLKYPNKYMIGTMNENVTGNSVHNSKNSTQCFDASNVWNCHYCSWLHDAKDCTDIMSWGFPAELCYQCTEVGDHGRNVLFSVSSYGASNTLYSYFTMYSSNIFGCVSMKKNNYCILNKQYSKIEYEKTISKIICHMQETGEWGEFFPMHLSPLAYNTSIAQDYFPMDKQSAESMGIKWFEQEKKKAMN